MARTKGTLGFSGNFEPQVSAPFDARMRVETKSELTLSTTWTAYDGSIYAYLGMITAVYNDGDNNGIYLLVASDYTQSESWVWIGESEESVDKSINTTSVVSGVSQYNVLEATGANSSPNHSVANYTAALTLTGVSVGTVIYTSASESVDGTTYLSGLYKVVAVGTQTEQPYPYDSDAPSDGIYIKITFTGGQDKEYLDVSKLYNTKPIYTISESTTPTSGSAKTYNLCLDGENVVGSNIEIPTDKTINTTSLVSGVSQYNVLEATGANSSPGHSVVNYTAALTLTGISVGTVIYTSASESVDGSTYPSGLYKVVAVGTQTEQPYPYDSDAPSDGIYIKITFTGGQDKEYLDVSRLYNAANIIADVDIAQEQVNIYKNAIVRGETLIFTSNASVFEKELIII